MAGCHVGHNCTVGNHVIITNGALLAGHVTVGDRAFVSGNCLIHQFTRVGTMSMMQGGAAISKDLPPYTIGRGINGLCGLNIIALRRSGVTSEERLELKRLYKQLFRSGGILRESVKKAQGEFTLPTAKVMLEFVAAAKRGVCADSGIRLEEEMEKPGEANV
jgi:UDP-N-acetylglucosamine acyltransferase